MHLRIAKTADDWTCAEVSLTRSLGYGTYRFVVRDTSQLEPAAVFGMFTWDYSGAPGQSRNGYRDQPVGNPESKNAQYIIQPYYVPPMWRDSPSRRKAHTFVPVGAGRAAFRTVRGARTGGRLRR